MQQEAGEAMEAQTEKAPSGR
jgi:hypothetical protein